MGFKKTTEGRVFFQRSNRGVDTMPTEIEDDMFAIRDVESYEDSLEHIQRSPLTGREINVLTPFEIKDPTIEKQAELEEAEEALVLEEPVAEVSVSAKPEVEEPAVETQIQKPEEQQTAQDNVLQTEILGLLTSLNDRLKTTKAERNRVQKQMDVYRTLIEGLETKSEETEKAYETLKAQVSGREKEAESRAAKAEKIALETRKELDRTRELLAEMEEKSRETDKTITALDTAHKAQKENIKKAIETASEEIASAKNIMVLTKQEVNEKSTALYEGLEKQLKETVDRQDSLGAQVDEALTQQAQLAQKIDKVAEDRTRFMRKIELIEQTVLQTRDALLSLGEEQSNKLDYAASPSLDVERDVEGQHLPQALLEQSRVRYEERQAGKAKSSLLKKIALSPIWPLMLAFVLGALLIVWLMSGTNFDYVLDSFKNKPSVSVGASVTAPVETSNVKRPSDEMLAHIPTLKMIDSVDISEEVSTDSPEVSLTEEVEGVTEEVITPENQTAPAEDTADEADAEIPLNEDAELTQNGEETSGLPDVIKKVEAAALKGSPEAQHDLGAIYVAGHAGVQQDYERAAYWFEQAAGQDVANAAYNLGVLHHQGLGVDADIKNALLWYKKAASLGHPEAQYNLGIAYIEGVGVNYSADKAAEYFKEAADQGIMEAAYNLGLIYENGLLGQTRPDDALLWYKVAADEGSEEARAAIEQLGKRLDMSNEEIKSYLETSQDDANTNVPIKLEKQTQAKPRPSAPLSPAQNKHMLISQIQEHLMKNGLYPGPADGAFGPLTSDAIRSYQSRNEIPVDGAVSETLLHHMLSNQG